MVSAFWLSKTRPRRCSGSARSCLSVCARDATLFLQPLFRGFLGRIHLLFHEKITQKRGSRVRYDADRDSISDWPPCRGRCTLLKWRLRRHPLVGLFGGDVGDYHLRRHLPPWVPF